MYQDNKCVLYQKICLKANLDGVEKTSNFKVKWNLAMKKAIYLVFIAVSFVALFLRFGLGFVLESVGFNTKAGVRITSIPEAAVFLDGVEVGQTPYQNENLKVGEYKVELKVGESTLLNGAWQGMVRLNPGTLSVVNRELSASIASSSGEILTLNQGKGVILTSSPNEADVEIDGKFYGRTPLVATDLGPGEHTFLLSHQGYLKRSIRASTPAQMGLAIAVDLAISEADLGNVGAYSNTTPLPKVVVKQTPTGFLRVRDKPSTSGKEIDRLSPGEEVVLLEELGGWMRLKLKDGTEGYVSASYVQKQP